MKITRSQLRRIIRESVGERDNVLRMKASILNKWMVDDTWHMEEDVLEDMLMDLGPSATPEQVDAVSDEWIAGVRSAKWHPRTDAERKADWSQGMKRRTDFTHYKEKFK